jgi:cobalt/nickel transport system permease protein
MHRSALPAFILLLQPIHLAMGVAEGFMTCAMIMFVGQTRPHIFTDGGMKVIFTVPPQKHGLDQNQM